MAVQPRSDRKPIESSTLQRIRARLNWQILAFYLMVPLVLGASRKFTPSPLTMTSREAGVASLVGVAAGVAVAVGVKVGVMVGVAVAVGVGVGQAAPPEALLFTCTPW